ncbi:hypothetical protein ACTWP4_17470 [Gracilibacillus sp. D59]|uniref:hypothetical protein n=1 Tax=Gracilibacillus sp. D59 TaxID=3457434 RepID=UPI003FCD2B8C
MSSFLLFGVLAIILFLFFRHPIIKKLESLGTLKIDSEKHKWLNNYWITGGVFFGVNALFFSSTILILMGISYLMLPYVHLFVMAGAVIISLFVCIWPFLVWNKDESMDICFNREQFLFYHDYYF